MGVSRKPNDYNREQANKVSGSPDSFPGCVGYFDKNQAKCRACQYNEICKKVVPRNEVEKLLQQLLEIATV